MQVKDVTGPGSIDAVLDQACTSKRHATLDTSSLWYAYGGLDISGIRCQAKAGAGLSADVSGAMNGTPFEAAFPPPACLGPPKDPCESPNQGFGEEGSEHLVVAANVWVGRNLTSRLHVDALDNLFCVSQGSKIVHLYSPWQLAELDPEPPSKGLPIESRWKSRLFHGPAEWPVGLQATAVAHVRTGECLFIPAGWFHEVFTISSKFSLAISFWCKSPTPETAARVRLRPSLLALAGAARNGNETRARGGNGDFYAFLADQQQRKRVKGQEKCIA